MNFAASHKALSQRTDEKDPEYPKMVAFPPEFRMVAGDPNLRSFNDTPAQNAITWACLGTNTPLSGGMPNMKCPDGLRAQVFFPSCWDGKNVDTPDHKSHLTYPSGVTTGACPASHPKRLISIFYEILFNAPNFEWSGNQHPFVLSHGDPTGYGFHGDFVNGWKEGVLQKAIDDCNIDSGVIEECKHLSFITNEVAQSCRVPASINEQTSGTVGALPGCNPVQSGPDPAKPQSGCGAPTTIGAPHFPFTDFTGSKYFAYTGCALDPQGQARTLNGASDERKDMTIDSCIDLCVKAGFNVAGGKLSPPYLTYRCTNISQSNTELNASVVIQKMLLPSVSQFQDFSVTVQCRAQEILTKFVVALLFSRFTNNVARQSVRMWP